MIYHYAFDEEKFRPRVKQDSSSLEEEVGPYEIAVIDIGRLLVNKQYLDEARRVLLIYVVDSLYQSGIVLIRHANGKGMAFAT